MKNILIFSLLIMIISCTKKSNQITSRFQNIQSVPAISILSSYERFIVGDWKLNSHQSYSNGNLIISDSYTNTIDCHIKLDSILDPNFSKGSAYPTAKESLNGIYTCNPTKAFWFVNDTILNLTGLEYRIQKLTQDTLIITDGKAYNAYTQKYTLWR